MAASKVEESLKNENVWTPKDTKAVEIAIERGTYYKFGMPTNGYLKLSGAITQWKKDNGIVYSPNYHIVCPHDVFLIKDRKAFIGKKDLCMECGACEKNCSEGAISVRSGVGCAAGIINGILRGGEPTCDCSSSKSNCC